MKLNLVIEGYYKKELKNIPDNSIDLIITLHPYELKHFIFFVV